MQSLREMLKESLRYTAFLGTFAGVYVAVDEGIAALFGKRRCASVAISALPPHIASVHQELTLLCSSGLRTGARLLQALRRGPLFC